MSKSKEKLQQAVLDVGGKFAASMDTLLDTELRYLKYLRNRSSEKMNDLLKADQDIINSEPKYV